MGLPPAVAFLLSPRGTGALEEARALRDEDPLRRRRALERSFSGEEARAALAMDDLRRRAAAKTPLADRLFFTRDALEQASPEAVAAERARRFSAFDVVADLGAGVGFDAIALALAGRRVRAVERDPVRAAFLRRNVAEAGVADRVEVVLGDLLAAPPAAAAAFLDPDRRPGGVRTRDAREFEPPPAAWGALRETYPSLLVKLPPVPPRALLGEPLEMVSLHGEMKETRVGFGALALPARRRALLLPSRTTVAGDGAPWPEPRAPVAGDVLLDPDPAVVVAGLVGEAARSIDAAPVHPRIAYLLGARAAPWATSLRVDAVLPASPAAIQRALDREDVGALTIRSRGVSDPPDAWRRRLSLRGSRETTLVLTREPSDRYVALLATSL
jgi:hypothetical protein